MEKYNILSSIGMFCFTIAIVLKLFSYYRQIQKTKRSTRSTQVSTSAFLCKLGEYIFSIISLILFANYFGAMIALAGLVMCIWALRVICTKKPKGWRLL